MAGNDQNKDDRPVSDWPNMDPRWWMLAAVTATFGLAIPGAIFAAVAVFSQKLPDTAHEMVTVLVPFGTIILALITFFTVVWRGLLTDQQVKEQRQQVKEQIRQNDAKDEEQMAKLLQEGAKLVGEQEKPSQVIAGISTLEILLKDPKRRYSIEAMDLLADLLMATYGAKKLGRINKSTIRGLRLGEKKGITSRVDGVFEREVAKHPFQGRWVYLPGYKTLSLKGGALKNVNFEKMRPKLQRLEKVQINDASIDATDPIFRECTFRNCTITNVSGYDLTRNNFERCDFSGLRIDDFNRTDMRFGDNFYQDGNPPIEDEGFALHDFFFTKGELDDRDDLYLLTTTVPDPR